MSASRSCGPRGPPAAAGPRHCGRALWDSDWAWARVRGCAARYLVAGEGCFEEDSVPVSCVT